MKNIVFTQSIPEECTYAYSKEYNLIFPSSENDDDISKYLKDAHAVISVGTPITPSILSCAGDMLKVVGTCTVGYDHIDVNECKRLNYKLVNAPQTVIHPTSEITVGLIIAAMRGIVWHDCKLRKELHVSIPFFPKRFTSLYGKTVGIVGFGRIGKTVARILYGFGMKIYYTDIFKASKEQESICQAEYVSFEKLLEASDVISVHCPYVPENHHLFNYEQFKAMKPSAYFINVARGKIMNESALVWALENKEIAGAGLDVYENEPMVTPRLADFENVVMVPHIGTNAYDVRVSMCIECIDGVVAVLNGDTPYNLVNI